ncbi:MAG: aminotransferase class V-fold PLP-dependent enzyme [Clostridia bacterium]|nr:aminotransferase class V-fold PLP-dependent enzyme [Clostridia bacterium]
MDDVLERVRAAMPALDQWVYLNTGTAGPLPTAVTAAAAEVAGAELRDGRIHREALAAARDRAEAARAGVAALLGAPPEAVALTQNTTYGIDLVLAGLPWRPGDEIVTTSLEYFATLMGLRVLAARCGLVVRCAELGDGGGDVVAAVERCFTPRTRLLVCSHVAYTTGALLPVAALCAMAHRHGVPVLVDGAQSFAAVPLEIARWEVDFYAVPGHKWLCGPEGTGALYVRPDRVAELLPPFVGWASQAQHDDDGFFLPRPGAARFELSTVHGPAVAGLAAACRWLREEVGVGWAQSRVNALAALARRLLAEVPGVRVVTPAQHAGLVTFQVEGRRPEEVVAHLAGRRILVRSVPRPPAVRLSAAFFNTEDEIEAAVAAVRECLP